MKRQPYFPRLQADEPEWYHNFALGILEEGPGLGFTTGEINAVVADCLYLEYGAGPWITAVREVGPAATASLAQLESGTSPGAFALPGFTAPPLPPASAPLPAVVAVAAGAQNRVFLFVQAVKAKPAYTEAIGLQLRIIGQEEATERPAPTLNAKLIREGNQQQVKLIFKKYGQPGVAIQGRRGGGAWEQLAIVLKSPYVDARPLLVAGVPEVREYRAQFYDGTNATGDFTDVVSVTVGP